MKMVQHPNVVRLYEVIDTATKLYLILELGDGGDMYDCIMKHEGGLSEEVRGVDEHAEVSSTQPKKHAFTALFLHLTLDWPPDKMRERRSIHSFFDLRWERSNF